MAAPETITKRSGADIEFCTLGMFILGMIFLHIFANQEIYTLYICLSLG